MTMTKKDVIELNAILGTLKTFGNTKFKYSIIKNLDLLKHDMAALAEVEKATNETISEFTKERNALILELGKQDDKGNTFVDPKDTEVIEQFSARLKELLEKHKDSVAVYNEKLGEFNDLLKEEVDGEFPFRKISVDQCPEDGISIEQLNKLVEFGIVTD